MASKSSLMALETPGRNVILKVLEIYGAELSDAISKTDRQFFDQNTTTLALRHRGECHFRGLWRFQDDLREASNVKKAKLKARRYVLNDLSVPENQQSLKNYCMITVRDAKLCHHRCLC